MFLLPCLFLPSLELPMPQVPELPNSVCFSCSCNAGLKINVSLIQAISHGSRGVLHKMTSGRLVVVSRLDPLSLLLNLGVLASPPRSSVLSWGSGVPSALLLFVRVLGLSRSQLPAYLCIYIYISPGSFPISFLDTNNPHCIGRTTWHLALHCITLHCIAVHCIALHCIAWHYIALHCIALHCIHCLTLHRNALHYVALHFIALHYIQLHYIASHCITLHCTCAAQTSVSCRGFLSGVLFRNSLGFLWLSPRVFKVLLRIHTGENKAKNLGFHLGIL